MADRTTSKGAVQRTSGLHRRRLLQLGGGLLLAPSSLALAQNKSEAPAATPLLELMRGDIALRSDGRVTKAARAEPLVAGTFKANEPLGLRLRNSLDRPVVMTLRGAGPISPLADVLNPGAEATVTAKLRHPGTVLASFASPERPDVVICSAPLVIAESTPSSADRDETILIEEWRLDRNGAELSPDTRDTANTDERTFTINGKLACDINIRRHGRLRFRFINSSQRCVIAIRIENHDLRVMAIDSRPSEPYLARNGQIALGPGSRLDAFVDGTGEAGSSAAILLHDGENPRTIGRLVYASEPPLRATRLPDPPPLAKSVPLPDPILRLAQRVELSILEMGSMRDREPLNNGLSDGVARLNVPPGGLKPLFSTNPGRTIVLALVNKTPKPVIFRLRGLSARLLDRLDDGWKPYWLDTIAVDRGQTTRIAFVPDVRGEYVIEGFVPEWGAPLRLRRFVVT